MVLLAISAGRPVRLRWLACSPVGVPSSSTPRNRSPPSVLASATTAATRSRSGRLLASLLNSTARVSPPRMSAWSAWIPCSTWCMAISWEALLDLNLAALLNFNQQGFAQSVQVPVHIVLVGDPCLVISHLKIARLHVIRWCFIDLRWLLMLFPCICRLWRFGWRCFLIRQRDHSSENFLIALVFKKTQPIINHGNELLLGNVLDQVFVGLVQLILARFRQGLIFVHA